MPEVSFAAALQSHVPCATQTVDAATLREALQLAFRAAPRLERYVLDEHGALRTHIAVFVDGRVVGDRTLSQAVEPRSRVFVVQALSGG